MKITLGLLMALLCAALTAPACVAPHRPDETTEARLPESDDWCAEHAVPESKCTKCNPSLIAEYKSRGDWCGGHGFPESVCPICNPVAPPRAANPQPHHEGRPPLPTAGDQAADWCAEHALPESKCTKCNPSLIAEYKSRGDWCGGHGFPESVCPICNPVAPPRAAAPGPLHDEHDEHDAQSHTPGAGHVADQAADWCSEHAVPESKCTKCNPSLIAEYKSRGDWCGGHGFPESVCPICNPVAPPRAANPQRHHEGRQPLPTAGDQAADWCIEHAVPESKCTKCNPSLIAEYKSRGDWCGGHGFPESVCPICNPVAPPPGAGLSIVRLRDEGIAASVGIATAAVEPARAGAARRVTGTVTFDQNTLAAVRAPLGGVVREVHVDLGARIEAGAPIFTLQSERVSELQATLRSAQEQVRVVTSQRDRERTLLENGAIPPRQLELTEARLAETQATLRAIGDALRYANAGKGSGRFVVAAPRAGIVVRRETAVGAVVDGHDALAMIADTSTMWVMLDVRAADASRISPGQVAELTVEGLPGRTWEGVVSQIGAELDPHTRTLPARVVLPNPDGQLRAGLFVVASLEDEATAGELEIPAEAVQQHPSGALVFVPLDSTRFEPRPVEVRGLRDGRARVSGRLQSGERVVTTGAFLLKTELVKGSIGAGCCDVKSLDEE